MFYRVNIYLAVYWGKYNMARSSLNRFNGIAPLYDVFASLIFGKELERAKHYYLYYIKDGCKILYIGGGSGTILYHLIKKHNNLEIDFIDASSKMIERAKKKVPHTGTCTINWIHGTEDNIPHQDHYDIVITNFFLDIFKPEELDILMPKIDMSLKRDGFWIFTDFYGRTKRLKNRILVRMMYFFFRILGAVKSNKLLSYGLYFEKMGYRRLDHTRFYNGLIETRVYGKYLGED